MTTDTPAEISSALRQHCAWAQGARDLAATMSQNAAEHGWDAVAETYQDAGQLLEEATAELRTLTGSLQAAAPVLAQVREDRSYPDVSTDLETVANALDEASSVLEAVGSHIDEALGQAQQVGAEHLAERLQELLHGLQETDGRVRALAAEVEAEIRTATAKTGPDPVPGQTAAISARIEQLRREGHGPQRHGAQVTDEQLTNRALWWIDPMTGTTTDGDHGGPHKCAKVATKVMTDSDYVTAEAFIRTSQDFRDEYSRAQGNQESQIRVTVPLEAIFGPGYRHHVKGVRRNGSKTHPVGTPPGSSPASAVDFTDGRMIAVYTKRADGEFRLKTMFPDLPGTP